MPKFDSTANRLIKCDTAHLTKFTAASMTYDELSELLDKKISLTRDTLFVAQRNANRDMVTGCRAELSALIALKHTLQKWFKMYRGEVNDNEEH